MLGSRFRGEVKVTQQAGREFCHCCNGRPESNSETMQKALHHALWEREVGHLAGVSGLLLWGCLSIHQSVRWPRVRHTLGSSRPRRSRRATSDTTARDVRVGDHGGGGGGFFSRNSEHGCLAATVDAIGTLLLWSVEYTEFLSQDRPMEVEKNATGSFIRSPRLLLCSSQGFHGMVANLFEVPAAGVSFCPFLLSLLPLPSVSSAPYLFLPLSSN